MARAPYPYAAFGVTTDRIGHIDIPMPVGTACPAIRAGKLVVRGYGESAGFYAILEEPDGAQVTYAHGNLPVLAVAGARFDEGETVLYSGGVGPLAGHSTGPHLHLGAVDSKGRPLDPFKRWHRSRYFWPAVVVASAVAVGVGVAVWRVSHG